MYVASTILANVLGCLIENMSINVASYWLRFLLFQWKLFSVMVILNANTILKLIVCTLLYSLTDFAWASLLFVF